MADYKKMFNETQRAKNNNTFVTSKRHRDDYEGDIKSKIIRLTFRSYGKH